jgi:hypothetical protein
MGKKQIALLTLVALLVPSVCMAALPKVELKPDCATAALIDGEGDLLLTSLGLFIKGLPTYAAADLENGATGDGVPDSYQLGLLSAAICAGETNLASQLAGNKALIHNNLILPLGAAVNLLFGTTTPLHPGIYDQAGVLSTDIRAWAAGAPEPYKTQATTFADTIDGLLLQINTFLADSDLTVADLKDYVGIALPLLGGVEDLIAGLVGLDSEMIGILYTVFTPTLQGQIEGYVTQISTQMIPLLQGLHANAGALGIGTELDGELVMAAADLTSAVGVVGPFVSFVADPGFAIYGVSGKSATEPFSGLGDYNLDGVTNATVFSNLTSAGAATRPAFVKAASGLDPYWAGRAGLPVAGLLGMALLAGVVALGGALSIRKK